MLTISKIHFAIKEKILLKDISLELEPGQLHLIMGPNGAGKSTFVKLVSRQVKPTQGSIYYNKVAIDHFSSNELAKIRVVLSQHNAIPFSLKVWEVVMMGRYPHYTGKPKQIDFDICEEMMEFAEVAAFAERDFNTLSGGEKQRVHFARVLTQLGNLSDKDQIKYFILDEPLNFLDIYYQHYFMQKLKSILNERLIIVGIIHDLHLALQYGDHLIFFKEGKLAAQGSPKTIMKQEILQEVFNVNLDKIQFGFLNDR